MKNLLFLLLAVTVFAEDFSPYKPIATVTLQDGRALQNLQIVSFTKTTVVAKWAEGRGTLAYENFPDGLRGALEKYRPKDQDTPSPQSPPAPKKEPSTKAAPSAGNKLDYIRSSGFDVKAFDVGRTIAHVAWKVTLQNVSGETISVRPHVTFKDEKGFKLNEERAAAVRLGPGQSKEFSESTVVSLTVWEQTKTFGLNVALVE